MIAGFTCGIVAWAFARRGMVDYVLCGGRREELRE